jgi:5-methyltetrahydropteroyltriglutamate--homocysteine methyltransferase
MCRGNNQSMWAAEGGYEHVAEALFGELNVDGYFMEYDDERSGGFEPLRFVPKGEQVDEQFAKLELTVAVADEVWGA